MKEWDILKKMPDQGFLKVVSRTHESLTSEQKARLAHKGEEAFQNGDIEQARKIFVTIGHTDGLVRIGDWFMQTGKPFDAYKMYRLAPAPDKAEKLVIRMAEVISRLLTE